MHRILFALVLLAALPVRAADEKKVEIHTSDQMNYDVTSITATPGQKITIILTNLGSIPKAAMAHNLVVLKPGSDAKAYAAAALTHGADGYQPPDLAGEVIAATKLLGPGESDTITFTVPAAGSYDYICTFPGHLLAGMRGQLWVQ